MISIIKAEYLKTKRSFGRKILWIAPVITFLMAFVFTLGMTNAYAESVWNWWYTLLLPGMLAIMGYLSIAKEKKIKYYNQVTLATDKRRLMLGKILYMAIALLFSNVLVFAGACVGGFLLSTSVPVGGAAATVLVLTVTYLWLIPLSLLLPKTSTGKQQRPAESLLHVTADCLPPPEARWAVHVTAGRRFSWECIRPIRNLRRQPLRLLLRKQIMLRKS